MWQAQGRATGLSQSCDRAAPASEAGAGCPWPARAARHVSASTQNRSTASPSVRLALRQPGPRAAPSFRRLASPFCRSNWHSDRILGATALTHPSSPAQSKPPAGFACQTIHAAYGRRRWLWRSSRRRMASFSTNMNTSVRCTRSPDVGRRSTVPASPVSTSELRMIGDNAGAHSCDLIMIGHISHLRGDHLQGAAPKRVAQHGLRRPILGT
jgi:hypothetical protein